jgi:hypothetical protein
VEAVPGVQVWLTADGKHWSTPKLSNLFRGLAEDSAEDGGGEGAGSGKPGVSLQQEPVTSTSYFLSGMYHGLSADPARVEVDVAGSKVTASVLTLAGSPGWGVWYASAPLSDTKLWASLTGDGMTVTVYDAAGKAVARTSAGARDAR